MDKLCSSRFAIATAACLAAFGCSRTPMSQTAVPTYESPPSSLAANTAALDSNITNENVPTGFGGGPASTDDDDPMKPTPDKGGNWDQSGFGPENGSGKTGVSPSGTAGPDDMTPNGTTAGGMKTDDPWTYQRKSEQTKKPK